MPPATKINFRFSFAKSSNFLLSPISSQEKRKAPCNRCPTYLRLWSLTTLCSQKSEMVSEGAPVYLNLQPSELLCFPGGLASALHPWDFKGKRKSYFLFTAPVSLSTASGLCQMRCFLGQAPRWTSMNHIQGEIRLWEALVFLERVRVEYNPSDVLASASNTYTHIYALHFVWNGCLNRRNPMAKPVLSCDPTNRGFRPWQIMDSTSRPWIPPQQFSYSGSFTRVMPKLVTWEHFQASKHSPWLHTNSYTAGSCPGMQCLTSGCHALFSTGRKI